MNPINRKKLILLVLFVAFISFSCDEVDELTEIDIDTSLTEVVTITFSEDNPESVNGTMLIDLSNNTQLQPYLDQIEDVEISSASYKFLNYVGSENASGTLSATAAGQNFGPFQHSFFSDTQNQTVFPFEGTTQLNLVADSILANNQVSIQFSGTQTPAQNGSLTLQVTMQVTVTAQPL